MHFIAFFYSFCKYFDFYEKNNLKKCLALTNEIIKIKTYTWNNITGVADTAEESSFLLEINFYFYFLFYTCI